MYVEHVANLQAEAQRSLFNIMGVRELHVDVMVWLQNVFWVGLAPHPLTHIEVGSRELQRRR